MTDNRNQRLELDLFLGITGPFQAEHPTRAELVSLRRQPMTCDDCEGKIMTPEERRQYNEEKRETEEPKPVKLASGSMLGEHAEYGLTVIDELDDQRIYILKKDLFIRRPAILVETLAEEQQAIVNIVDVLALLDAHSLNTTANNLRRDNEQLDAQLVSAVKDVVELRAQLAAAQQTIDQLRKADTVRPPGDVVPNEAEAIWDQGYRACSSVSSASTDQPENPYR